MRNKREQTFTYYCIYIGYSIQDYSERNTVIVKGVYYTILEASFCHQACNLVAVVRFLCLFYRSHQDYIMLFFACFYYRRIDVSGSSYSIRFCNTVVLQSHALGLPGRDFQFFFLLFTYLIIIFPSSYTSYLLRTFIFTITPFSYEILFQFHFGVPLDSGDLKNKWQFATLIEFAMGRSVTLSAVNREPSGSSLKSLALYARVRNSRLS
jgi:hypothetical protein